MNTRSRFSIFLLAGILLVGANVCFGQQATNHPAPDVDGRVWMASNEQERRDFLFGAGSAFVLEYHLREKHSEEPSKYVKGWVDGLKDMTWADLSGRITAFYRSNPDKMDKHVFSVIWHNVIVPNLNK